MTGYLLSLFSKHVREKSATHPTTASDTRRGEQPDKLTVIATVLVFIVINVFIFLLSFASLGEEMREQHSAYPATTKDARPNEQAGKSPVSAVFHLTVIDIAVLSCSLIPVAKQMSEKQSAHPATASDAACNQQSGKSPIILVCFTFVLIEFREFPVTAAPLPQKMGKQQSTNAAPSGNTARKQESYQLAVFAAGLLVVLGLILSATDQMSEKEVTHTTTAQHPAPNEQADKLLVVLTAFRTTNLARLALQ